MSIWQCLGGEVKSFLGLASMGPNKFIDCLIHCPCVFLYYYTVVGPISVIALRKVNVEDTTSRKC